MSDSGTNSMKGLGRSSWRGKLNEFLASRKVGWVIDKAENVTIMTVGGQVKCGQMCGHQGGHYSPTDNPASHGGERHRYSQACSALDLVAHVTTKHFFVSFNSSSFKEWIDIHHSVKQCKMFLFQARSKEELYYTYNAGPHRKWQIMM